MAKESTHVRESTDVQASLQAELQLQRSSLSLLERTGLKACASRCRTRAKKINGLVNEKVQREVSLGRLKGEVKNGGSEGSGIGK